MEKYIPEESTTFIMQMRFIYGSFGILAALQASPINIFGLLLPNTSSNLFPPGLPLISLPSLLYLSFS